MMSPIRDFVHHKQTSPSRKEKHAATRSLSGKWVVCFLGVFVVALMISVAILVSRSRWNGKSARGFILVFGDQQKNEELQCSITLGVLQPQEQQVSLLPLPDDLVVETLYGYGQYPVSALCGLMALDKLPRKFLLQTLSMQFGVFLEDVVYLPKHTEHLSLSQLSTVFFRQMTLREKSSFPFLDRYHVWAFLRGLRKDQLTVLDLQSSGAIKQGNAIDLLRLDPIMLKIFSDSEVRKEDLSVAVLNTTQEARLGTRVARALSVMGVNVINVSNTSDALKQSNILYAGEQGKKSRVIQIMEKLFAIHASQIVHDEEKARTFRADVVFLVGEDVAGLFTTRP